MRLFLVLLALVLFANAQSEEFNEQDGGVDELTVGNYGCTPKHGFFMWHNPQWNCAYFGLHKNYRYYAPKDRCLIVNACCFVDEKGDCGASRPSSPQPQQPAGCGYGRVAKHTYRAGDARTGSCPSGFTRVTDKKECQTAPGTLKVKRTFNRYVKTVPLRTTEAVHIACEHHNVPGVGCWFITHPWPRYNGKKYFTEASCHKNNHAWAWFQYPLCKSVTASCATASSETEMETELSSSEAIDMLMNDDSAESQSDETGIASAALPRLMEEEFSTEDDQE